MVTQSITQQTQGDLRRNGYRLETTHGWDTHEVPLYTHKAVNDKKPGDVAWKAHIGNLKQMDQAEAQKESRNLFIEDGWVYFLHGWLCVIAEVFDLDIPSSGPEFEELGRIAANMR